MTSRIILWHFSCAWLQICRFTHFLTIFFCRKRNHWKWNLINCIVNFSISELKFTGIVYSSLKNMPNPLNVANILALLWNTPFCVSGSKITDFDSTIFNNFGETLKVFAKNIDLYSFVGQSLNFHLIPVSYYKMQWFTCTSLSKLTNFQRWAKVPSNVHKWRIHSNEIDANSPKSFWMSS